MHPEDSWEKYLVPVESSRWTNNVKTNFWVE